MIHSHKLVAVGVLFADFFAILSLGLELGAHQPTVAVACLGTLLILKKNSKHKGDNTINHLVLSEKGNHQKRVTHFCSLTCSSASSAVRVVYCSLGLNLYHLSAGTTLKPSSENTNKT